MRKSVALSLIACVAFALSTEAVPRKAVIWHGWDMLRVTTEDVWRNRDKFASVGCDGVLFPLSRMTAEGCLAQSRDIFCAESYCDADFGRSVGLARECLQKDGLRESMALMFMIPKKRLAWTDDAAWERACSNVAVFARAAKAAGFKGLAIDNEDYTKQHQFMFRDEDPDLPEIQELVRRRGRRFFQSLFNEFPDAVVFSMWGFSDKEWVVRASDSKYAQTIGGFLWMSFLNGMLDVIPPKAKFVNGNEENGYRCDGDENAFRVLRDLSTRGALAMVSPENRNKYRCQVKETFGQYADMTINPKEKRWHRPALEGSRMRRFQRNLAAASAIADDLIWMYGEQGTIIDWDVKNHKWLQYPTWETLLPGFSQILRTAGGDLSSFRVLAESGKLKRLTLDAAGTISLTNCAPVIVASPDRLYAGDVVYVRMKEMGPYPSISLQWIKDGVPVRVNDSGILIPPECQEECSERMLDERFVVPEGANGLKIILGAPWAKRTCVHFKDLELFVFEQKDAK